MPRGGARPGAGRKPGVPTNRPKIKTQMVSVRLTPASYDRAKAMANERGITLSALIDLLCSAGDLPK